MEGEDNDNEFQIPQDDEVIKINSNFSRVTMQMMRIK
jgi:hypothetical protein